ncbi:alpha/beta hydrolases superfamily protein [Tanacetum coccineum]
MIQPEPEGSTSGHFIVKIEVLRGSTILLMTRLADAADADCCYYRRHKSLLLLSHLAAAVRDYVGWLCVNDTGKPIDILERLNEMVGFAPYEEIELFQEYRSGFDVQCLRVDKTLTFLAKKLRDGDIICFQKHLKVVRFRSLEKTKEDAFSLTFLMYGAEDPSIAGMVLDSPFSDLVDLMMELVDTYKIRLPKFTVKFAIQYMKRAILKKAKFDISELNTIKSAKSSFVPVLFGHAVDDDFIHPHHSDRIYEAYMGDKNIIKFEGDHNSPRPQFYFDSINIFFHNVLRPPEDEVKGNFFDSSLDYLSRDIHGVGYEDDILITPQASSSTEDAINQLRSKRPMSKTDVSLCRSEVSSIYGAYPELIPIGDFLKHEYVVSSLMDTAYWYLE